MNKDKPISKCCNAEINIQEEGVSQMSYDVTFTCSKCGRKLEDVQVSDYPNW